MSAPFQDPAVTQVLSVPCTSGGPMCPHSNQHPESIPAERWHPEAAVTCPEGRDGLPPLTSNGKTGKLLAEQSRGHANRGPTYCPDGGRKGEWSCDFHEALVGAANEHLSLNRKLWFVPRFLQFQCPLQGSDQGGESKSFSCVPLLNLYGHKGPGKHRHKT